jgi:V-type H+-transporting ATPase subunit a
MISISYLAGTIDSTDQMRFKKMVYRATRGKALTYFRALASDGLQDYAGLLDQRPRTVYVIVFQEGSHIRDKLIKICDSFMGKNFDIPQSIDNVDMSNRISGLQRRIDDARSLIGTTRFRLRDFLREIQKIS